MTSTRTPRTTFFTVAKVSTYASLFCLYSLAVITSATLLALTPAYAKHVGKAFQARVGHTDVQQEVPASVPTYTQYARAPPVRAVEMKPAHSVLGDYQGGVHVGIVEPEQAWIQRIQVIT